MAYTINQMFHSAMFLTYVFTMYRGFLLKIPMVVTEFKKFDPGQFKYLTIWNVVSLCHIFATFFLSRIPFDESDRIGRAREISY